MAAGMADDSIGHWSLEDDGMTTKPQPSNGKPPYAVPSVKEIRSLPWNGLKVASTFSGCGGSCLGYRMAGFQVVYANEWDKNARESYILNHGASIDPRDIRDIKPDEVLKAVRMRPGELDVLDGSPPCQGFSTAGSRDLSDSRNNLFWEYARLLKGIQPKAFVAENVSGMVKGTMKGIFLEVLGELKACGYRVRCRVLDAQWLGVPQVRKRVIFVGFREELEIEPSYPAPLPYRYSVQDACPWIAQCIRDESYGWEKDQTEVPSATIRSGRTGTESVAVYERGEKKPGSNWNPHNKTFNNKPCGTIPAFVDDCFQVKSGTKKRKFTIPEVKRICSFPDDFQLAGSYAQQWARLGNSVPPRMMEKIAACVRDQLHSI